MYQYIIYFTELQLENTEAVSFYTCVLDTTVYNDNTVKNYWFMSYLNAYN